MVRVEIRYIRHLEQGLIHTKGCVKYSPILLLEIQG